MGKPFLIESAKSSKDLESAYKKVEQKSGGYGFSKTTALKIDVVKKAMDEAKKPAEFLVEIEPSKAELMVQLVCEVKGKMRSVLGRAQFTKGKDLLAAKDLAKLQQVKDVISEWGM